MGWYGGQEGARRLRCRTSIDEALSRFRQSFQNFQDFTKLEDNHDFTTLKLLMHHPEKQADIIATINKTEEGDVPTCDAIAVAFAEQLVDLSGVSDAVCKNLKGIFLFGTINMSSQVLLDFIRRAPNLEAMTLAGVDAFDASFVKKLFEEKLLRNLKKLEVQECNDDAIEAMASAPNLQRITFRSPSSAITNEGFIRLVEAGGAKELVSIKAGVLKKHVTKTLSQRFLATKLPKFKSSPESMRDNLENMIQGIDGGRLKAIKADMLPFAVVPIYRMTTAMLRQAIKNRPHLKMPKHPTVRTMTEVLENGGFSMAQERSIQKQLSESAQGKENVSGVKRPIDLVV